MVLPEQYNRQLYDQVTNLHEVNLCDRITRGRLTNGVFTVLPWKSATWRIPPFIQINQGRIWYHLPVSIFKVPVTLKILLDSVSTFMKQSMVAAA
jgi:hypothetical protein